MKTRLATQFLGIPTLLCFLGLNRTCEGKDLRAVYSAIAGSQAVFLVTRDAGMFKKYDLDVSLIFVQGGTNAALTVFTGDVPLAIMAGVSALQLNSKGGDLVFIAGLLNSSDYALVVAPEIKTPADLKAKKLSISRTGDFSDFVARRALQKLGLVPDKEVAVLQFGDQRARFAALQKGVVQATIVNPPNILVARKLGLRVLADAEKLAIPAQGTAVVTSKRSLAESGAEIRRFVRALVEGIWFYKNRPNETKRSIAQYLKLNAQDEIDDTYNYYRGLLPAAPYPTEEGINNLIELSGPTKSPLMAKDQIDNRFVAELEESGFIKTLYQHR
jgi:NitT/TauT family transport system substrate-binding protein